ncbi:Hypothetical predicted protein [Olea europaea subsp. europaea]|uniref:Uncharacterized protein n=1 Tax=Olea europaea subsp. europaea TaxID=158383 RepID=A0A8S0U5G5_OLEEU|nr:Hypothetical predicted protein [Olea europaea subsp. europaea]
MLKIKIVRDHCRLKGPTEAQILKYSRCTQVKPTFAFPWHCDLSDNIFTPLFSNKFSSLFGGYYKYFGTDHRYELSNVCKLRTNNIVPINFFPGKKNWLPKNFHLDLTGILSL